MDYTIPKTVWIAYAISNIIGIFFLWSSLKHTRLTRLLFFLLFSWASVVNWQTASNHPELYLQYAERSVSLYRNFIQGWFSEHIRVCVSSIAIGQFMIASGMILRGAFVKLACTGAIIFLMAIAPLGIYAAFPFSLTVSASAFLIIKKDPKLELWKKPQ